MKIRVVLAFDCNNMLHNTKYMFEYLNQIEDYEIKYIINNSDLKKKLMQKYGNKFIGTKTKLFTTSNVATVYSLSDLFSSFNI